MWKIVTDAPLKLVIVLKLTLGHVNMHTCV